VAFADSAITLEVGFWVKDPEIGTLALRSDINLEVLRRFRAAGIEIPFPQREITVRQPTVVDLSSTPLAAASVRSPTG
jgi:small-conductance mechanosensitive channel